MGVIPVTCSITASFMSAITLIGMPAEIYTAGSTINYQLSTVNCQLSTINYQLSTVNCQLSTVNCQLSTVSLWEFLLAPDHSYDLVNIQHLSLSFLPQVNRMAAWVMRRSIECDKVIYRCLNPQVKHNIVSSPVIYRLTSSEHKATLEITWLNYTVCHTFGQSLNKSHYLDLPSVMASTSTQSSFYFM